MHHSSSAWSILKISISVSQIHLMISLRESVYCLSTCLSQGQCTTTTHDDRCLPLMPVHHSSSALNISKISISVSQINPGSKFRFFPRKPKCIFKSYLKLTLCRESNWYIFGPPAEILGSRRIIQGSPGLPAPPNSEPCKLIDFLT